MAEVDGQTPAGRPTRPGLLDNGEIWLRTPLSRCPHCGELLGDNPYRAPTSPWFCSVGHYAAWRDKESAPAEIPETGTAADAGAYDGG